MSIGRVLSSSGSIPTGVVLSGVYLYSRIQARSGHALAAPSQSSMRSSLASTRLARHIMRFRMRDGARVRCRIVDSGGLLSVNVDRDYDVPGVDWEALRAIVDVGAHVGTFTVWAALRSPRARILAIEPNPETFALLERNIQDNGLQDRVVAIKAAVGTEAGTGTLELVEHSLGTRLARTGGGTVKVNVDTVPSFLAAAGMTDVDLLKIDCEGMEYAVFEELDLQQLPRLNVIACEYHPEPGHNPSELDVFFAAAGFKVQRPEAPLGVIWATR
jgi:FkbM family methyltransferase